MIGIIDSGVSHGIVGVENTLMLQALLETDRCFALCKMQLLYLLMYHLITGLHARYDWLVALSDST
jgi:hypothetical protein